MVGGEYLESDEEKNKVFFYQFQFRLLITLEDSNQPDSHIKQTLQGANPEVSGDSWGQLLNTAARCANRGDAHLDLIVAIREMQVRDVKSNVSLGCSPHEAVGSELSKGVSKESNRVHMPGLRGEDLGLFRALVSRMPLGDSVWE